MNKSFLTLPPCRRAKKLKSLLHVFQQNAKTIELPFSIIAYGSSSYGFNRRNHGKLDDLDFFLIVPRTINPEQFISNVQMVFLTKISIQMAHLQSVLAGAYDICRMYGQVGGIKIGFRIMCSDTFTSICSQAGSVKPIRNIASIGQSRIVKDKEWNFKIARYVPIIYQNEFRSLNGEDVLLVIHYCFSKRRNRLGPLARKLLMGTVVFEADGQQTITNLHDLWVMFVRNSLKYRPNLSPASIVESIIRSERFSSVFKAKLCELVYRITLAI